MDFFIPAPPDILLLTNQLVPHYAVIPDPEDSNLGNTYLGTPYYDQLVLKYTETVGSGPTTTTTISFQTVLIDVNQSKNILMTPIYGNKGGTVKEYISDGDYFIKIIGAIVSQYANLYPADAVRQMVKICRISDTLEVESGFLGRLDINSVVVKDFHIYEKMGSRNMVPFDLLLISDKPIEFQLG